MNSKANLTTLPLLHVETHTSQLSRLEQVVSIGQPKVLEMTIDVGE